MNMTCHWDKGHPLVFRNNKLKKYPTWSNAKLKTQKVYCSIVWSLLTLFYNFCILGLFSRFLLVHLSLPRFKSQHHMLTAANEYKWLGFSLLLGPPQSSPQLSLSIYNYVKFIVCINKLFVRRAEKIFILWKSHHVILYISLDGRAPVSFFHFLLLKVCKFH